MDFPSLPFDGSRRFARDIQDHAIDFWHFVDNPIGHASDGFIRKPSPISGHCVGANYGADSDDVLVGSSVAHNTYALGIRQDGEALPKFFVQARVFDFVDHDPVGSTQDFELFVGSPRP